jgi:AcrR family transcriptional regulator
MLAMRRKLGERFDQMVDAALRVFGDKGYRQTQMADVAREMGVSPGTLYNYVESKEGLFHLVIDRAFSLGPPEPPASLPFPTPPPGATLAIIRERLADTALPQLEAAPGRSPTGDPRGELEGIVRELYALIERRREGIVVLERSALELPDLATLFYFEKRRGLLDRIERYLTARMSVGDLRPAPYPAAVARLILETVAWFAMHRHGDRDGVLIGDIAARETVVHVLVDALTSAPVRPKSALEYRGARRASQGRDERGVNPSSPPSRRRGIPHETPGKRRRATRNGTR